MRIVPEGNIGIGMLVTTPLPAGEVGIDVGGATAARLNYYVGGVRKAFFISTGNSTAFGTHDAFPLYILTANVAHQIIAADGSIGMGYSPTTDAGRVLTTNSQAAVSTAILLRCVGTIAGSISHPTGTTTAFNTSSDARLKRNIRPVKDVGKIIDNIPVVSFDWKTDGIHVPVGMIAQDVHGVFPQAVYEGSDVDTDPWQLDHSKMVPLLLKEIQSLRERVNVLEHGCH